MRTKGFLSKIALIIHRTAADSLLLANSSSIAAKYFLFGSFALVFLLVFVPAISLIVSDWSDIQLDARIPDRAWKVYYGSAKAPCTYDAAQSAQCPANAESPKLWQSQFSRSDADHVARVRGLQGQEFWVGVSIPPALLKTAFRARANQLLLGWIRGTHRIWVDGKFYVSGIPNALESLIIPIPMPRLHEEKPLRISIQIIHDVGHTYPDFLNSGVIGEGFMTYSKAANYQSFRSFMARTRNATLALGYLLIALVFFLFWSSAKTKQEYFYMAIFALVCSFSHFLIIDAIVASVGGRKYYLLYSLLSLFEGGFAMFLGLSFARVRSSVFRIGMPLVLLTPVLVAVSIHDSATLFYSRELIAKWIVPGFCFVGAAACLLQAAHLYAERSKGSYLPIRIRRLLLFAAGLAAVAFVYWINASAQWSLSRHTYWHRCINLMLVCGLAAVVFSEYRERERQSEKTPVSEYHRRVVLPEQISGAILVADLKASEAFYRQRAIRGNSENMVAIWRSHFYTSIMKFGGIILHTKGDEVMGFFDSDKCESPLLAAVRAVDEMTHASNLLDSEFRDQNFYPAGVLGLYFRASVALGAIRPVWESFGTSRAAVWEEAGSSAALVEGSRLLEAERGFGTGKDTLLILSECAAAGIVAQYPLIAPRFIVRDKAVLDKHQHELRVAVYRPHTLVALVKRAA